MSRLTLKRNHRKLCVGDLKDRITLQTRDLTEPVFGARDFTETFVTSDTVWAKVVTTQGRTFFDGVQTDQVISHQVTIRYLSTVTPETWILLDDGNRLDIIDQEDLEERNEYLRLLCTDRGPSTKAAASA